MARPALEVADIFRDHGAAWRNANAGHISLGQLKVMSAIERCRTAALGGHVVRCEDCDHTVIAFNSCRDRHCPKCQAAAARKWLADREAELLPVGYFHLVFTLPKSIADIAYQNKAVIYDLLFKASAETMLTIAADPKHLGAKVGFTSVLHSWGSAMVHHPHIHMIVPGGGIAMDGSRWVSCRPNFFLPVRVLSRLFRGLILKGLKKPMPTAGYSSSTTTRPSPIKPPSMPISSRSTRPTLWFMPRNRSPGRRQCSLTLPAIPIGSLSQNRRLISIDDKTVTFNWKDYRAEGPKRYTTMNLDIHEFIRRFLIHVFPKRFHHIRHYGLLANGHRANNVALARRLLAAQDP